MACTWRGNRKICTKISCHHLSTSLHQIQIPTQSNIYDIGSKSSVFMEQSGIISKNIWKAFQCDCFHPFETPIRQCMCEAKLLSSCCVTNEQSGMGSNTGWDIHTSFRFSFFKNGSRPSPRTCICTAHSQNHSKFKNSCWQSTGAWLIHPIGMKRENIEFLKLISKNHPVRGCKRWTSSISACWVVIFWNIIDITNTLCTAFGWHHLAHAIFRHREKGLCIACDNYGTTNHFNVGKCVHFQICHHSCSFTQHWYSKFAYRAPWTIESRTWVIGFWIPRKLKSCIRAPESIRPQRQLSLIAHTRLLAPDISISKTNLATRSWASCHAVNVASIV